MSDEARKQAQRRWILEVWGGGDLALVDRLVSPGYVFRAPGLGEVRGPEAIKGLVTTYRTTFPDFTNTIDEQVAEGDVVVTRGTMRATHRAPLGDIAATGRSVTVPWILMSRFDGERIADEYEIYDALGLMQQLGAVPTPARTGG